MKTTLRPSKIKGILSKNIKSMAATLAVPLNSNFVVSFYYC
ncbi:MULTISPECIES: hypothetical protein [Paenibacillus]|nr:MULTISPECIES: hypothetical protein [Paenibacillus]